MVSALESRDTSLRRGKSSLAPPLQPALVLSFDRPAFAGRSADEIPVSRLFLPPYLSDRNKLR